MKRRRRKATWSVSHPSINVAYNSTRDKCDGHQLISDGKQIGGNLLFFLSIGAISLICLLRINLAGMASAGTRSSSPLSLFPLCIGIRFFHGRRLGLITCFPSWEYNEPISSRPSVHFAFCVWFYSAHPMWEIGDIIAHRQEIAATARRGPLGAGPSFSHPGRHLSFPPNSPSNLLVSKPINHHTVSSTTNFPISTSSPSFLSMERNRNSS